MDTLHLSNTKTLGKHAIYSFSEDSLYKLPAFSVAGNPGIMYPSADWMVPSKESTTPYDPTGTEVLPPQALKLRNDQLRNRIFREKYFNNRRTSQPIDLATKVQYMKDERHHNKSFNIRYKIDNNGQYSDEIIDNLNYEKLALHFHLFKEKFEDKYPPIPANPTIKGQVVKICSPCLVWITKSAHWRRDVLKTIQEIAPRDHAMRHIDPAHVRMFKVNAASISRGCNTIRLQIEPNTITFSNLLNPDLNWNDIVYSQTKISFVHTNPGIQAPPRILAAYNIPHYMFASDAHITSTIPHNFRVMVKRLICVNIANNFVRNGYNALPYTCYDLVRLYFNPSYNLAANDADQEADANEIRKVIDGLRFDNDDLLQCSSDDVRDWVINLVHNLCMIRIFEPKWPPNLKIKKLNDCLNIIAPSRWIQFIESSHRDENGLKITPIHTENILIDALTGNSRVPTAKLQLDTERIAISNYKTPIVQEFTECQWKCPRCNRVLAEHTIKGCLKCINWRNKEELRLNRLGKQRHWPASKLNAEKAKICDGMCLRCSHHGHKVINCHQKPACSMCGGGHPTLCDCKKCPAIATITKRIIEAEIRLFPSGLNANHNGSNCGLSILNDHERIRNYNGNCNDEVKVDVDDDDEVMNEFSLNDANNTVCGGINSNSNSGSIPKSELDHAQNSVRDINSNSNSVSNQNENTNSHTYVAQISERARPNVNEKTCQNESNSSGDSILTIVSDALLHKPLNKMNSNVPSRRHKRRKPRARRSVMENTDRSRSRNKVNDKEEDEDDDVIIL
eukprot:481027_1